MIEEKRKTGLDFIPDLPWGTHFSQFYETKEDLIDILVPYFKAGLKNNEFCMWVTSEPLKIEDAKKALKKAVKNLDIYIKKRQIEILDYSQWYTKSGRFVGSEVLSGWVKKEKQALKKGFDGLRLTGNTFWLEKKDWRDFADYEAILNDIFGNHRMLAICTYSLNKCEATEIIDVVNNHQFSLIRKEGEWDVIKSTSSKKIEEKSRFHSEIMTNLSEGVNLFKASNRSIIYTNPTFEKMFGYDTGELIGKHVSVLNAPAEKNPKELVEEIMRSLNKDGIWEGEIKNIKKDGTHFFTFASLVSYDHTEFGKVFITVQNDITDRKKSEEEVSAAKAALEQKNIALREMLVQLETEKKNIKENVESNIEELLLPVIKKLKKGKVTHKSLDLVEKNLEKITSSFGTKVSEKRYQLTPREIEICNMIRSGLSSKEVADELYLSADTIQSHRKHIRKKMHITNKKLNLTSFLQDF